MEDHPYKPIDVDKTSQEISPIASEKLKYEGKEWFYYDNNGSYEIKVLGEEPGIARTHGGYSLFDEEKHLNHAKLIAAAPEMYEFLKDIQPYVINGNWPKRLRDLLEKMEKYARSPL